MLLEQENQSPVADASWSQIEAALDTLDPDRRSFVVLSSRSKDYVQTAGAGNRLTIEYRRYSRIPFRRKFRHWVLGRPTGGTAVTEIACNCGPIRVAENEVLTIDDAKRVFRRFFDGASVTDGYALREMTDRFA